MGKIAAVLMLSLLIPVVASAEFDVYDAKSNYMGVLVSVKGISDLDSYLIYNPTQRRYFDIITHGQQKGDLPQIKIIYYSQIGCTGQAYSYGPSGNLKGYVVKYGTKYYVVTGGVSQVAYQSSKILTNTTPCSNGSGVHKDYDCSKISPVTNSFPFPIPVSLPLRLQYRQ